MDDPRHVSTALVKRQDAARVVAECSGSRVRWIFPTSWSAGLPEQTYDFKLGSSNDFLFWSSPFNPRHGLPVLEVCDAIPL